jgi:hypothetical protein
MVSFEDRPEVILARRVPEEAQERPSATLEIKPACPVGAPGVLRDSCKQSHVHRKAQRWKRENGGNGSGRRAGDAVEEIEEKVLSEECDAAVYIGCWIDKLRGAS